MKDDTISRQAAIDALLGITAMRNTIPLDSAIFNIKNLPSVQPETNCSEIPNNSDTISRHAAIDTLRKMQTYKLFSGDDMLLIDQAEAQTELMMMPSVQPEIIRCKDCKHSRFFDPCFYCYEMGEEIIVPENGFCFKAERRRG